MAWKEFMIACVLFGTAFDIGFTGMWLGFVRRGPAPKLVPCTVSQSIFNPYDRTCDIWVVSTDNTDQTIPRVFACTTVTLFETSDQWGDHCLDAVSHEKMQEEECTAVTQKVGKCWQRWDGILWLTLSDLYFSVLDTIIIVAVIGSSLCVAGVCYLKTSCRRPPLPSISETASTPLLLRAMPVDDCEVDVPLATVVSLQ